jgi:DoxX-like family
MNLLTTLTLVLAALFALLGSAKLLAVPAMQTRAAHVRFSVVAYRRIGALELTGAVGLLAGMAVPALQTAASVGLLLLLVGAVAAHLRAGDGIKGAAPALVVTILVAVLIALAARQL